MTRAKKRGSCTWMSCGWVPPMRTPASCSRPATRSCNPVSTPPPRLRSTACEQLHVVLGHVRQQHRRRYIGGLGAVRVWAHLVRRGNKKQRGGLPPLLRQRVGKAGNICPPGGGPRG